MYELYKDMIFDLNIKKPYNDQQVYLYDLSQNKQKFITDALIENKIQLIENLIKCKCINLDYIRNLIIPFATKNNHWKIIYLILNDERFVQTPNGNYLLGWACKYGYYKIVKHLLTKATPKVDPSDNNNQVIRLACKNGHLKIVELLLNDIRSYSNFKTLLRWILKNKKINILKIILKINKKNKYHSIVKSVLKHGNIADYTLLLEQHIDNMYILKYATKINNKNIILLMAKLIYNSQFYDPIINNNYLLNHACKYGYIDIVKLLLSDNRIDPTFDNNYAIRCACKNEKFEIFDLLSRLHRIKYDQDLTDKLLTLAIKNDKPHFIRSILLYANQSTNLINLNNYCINLFNKLFNNNDYICILEVLLKYYQHHLNQNIIDNLLKLSIKENKLEIIEIILKYSNVASNINHEIIDKFVSQPNIDHFNIYSLLLLKDIQIDPDIGNFMIKNACKNNYIKIFDLLIKDKYIKLNSNILNDLFILAMENNNLEIVKKIYEYYYTYINDGNNFILTYIFKNNYQDIFEDLIKYYQIKIHKDYLNELFKISIKEKKLKFIQLFITYCNVNLNINNNYPIKILYIDNNIKIAKLLIQNEKFKFDNIDPNIIDWIFSS